jgi:hypothetical protein
MLRRQISNLLLVFQPLRRALFAASIHPPEGKLMAERCGLFFLKHCCAIALSWRRFFPQRINRGWDYFVPDYFFSETLLLNHASVANHSCLRRAHADGRVGAGGDDPG